MLGEGVVDVAVLREAAKLVLSRPGARAAQISVGNKDPKDDQELYRNICGGGRSALIWMKHGCVMDINR